MAVILVSACLLGCPCRYKGDGKLNEKVLALAENNTLVPVCPEQLGGLKTPRAPAEEKDGRIITKDGLDVTSAFDLGAQTALKIAKIAKADYAILKARSPSCGSGKIYDGSFCGRLIDGDGRTAALLKQSGFRVISEED